MEPMYVHTTRALFGIFFILFVIGAVFWYDAVSNTDGVCQAQGVVNLANGMDATAAAAADIVCLQNATNEAGWAKPLTATGAIGAGVLLVPFLTIEKWW